MSSNPVVSLVMKVYNGETYLKQAIDSILAQTFSDFEFIIIDDGSTDSSADIIKSYTDPRIRFLQNEKNLGLCETQNIAINAATGKYIAVMDCDDISYPKRFEKQVAFLEANPDVMLCGTARNDITEYYTIPFRGLMPLKLETLRFTLLFGNFYFTHSSIMFRAKEYKENGFSYELPICEDYDVISRIAERFPVAMVNQRLIAYRVLPSSISQRKAADIKKYTADIQCRMLSKLPISSEAKTLLSDYFKTGVATAPLMAFYNAVTEVAACYNADISSDGNAAPFTVELAQIYLRRKPSYCLSDWIKLKSSPFPQFTSFSSGFGRRLFCACLLHYKRK